MFPLLIYVELRRANTSAVAQNSLHSYQPLNMADILIRICALFPEYNKSPICSVKENEGKFLDPHQKLILGREPFSVQVLWKSAQ